MAKPKWPRKECKTFEVPLFGGYMNVFYSREHFDQALTYLNVDQEDLEAFGGLVMHLQHPSAGVIYLVGIFEHDASIIAHEAVHVAQYVMNYVGADDDETQAYLVQRVFEFIEKHLPICEKE